MQNNETPQQEESTALIEYTPPVQHESVIIHSSDINDIPLRLAPWQTRLVRRMANRKKNE